MLKMEVPPLPQAIEIVDDGFTIKAPKTKRERAHMRAMWMREYGGEFNRAGRAKLREKKHVYVIRAANGLIKIGSAFDIELRCDQLQTMSPIKLELIGWVQNGGEKLERKLHQMLRQRRSHGEWFETTQGEVKAFAEALLADRGNW